MNAFSCASAELFEREEGGIGGERNVRDRATSGRAEARRKRKFSRIIVVCGMGG